jgi:ATP-dependent Lon protease
MAKKDNDKTPKKYNLRKKKKKVYKVNEISDSDSDSDWTPGMEEEDDIERTLEFQKFLQKMFPSKNQTEKVNQLKNIKKMLNKDETKEAKKNKKNKKLKEKNKKLKEKNKNTKEDEEDEEDEEEDEEYKEEEYIDDDEWYQNFIDKDEFDPQNMKFNIVFTVTDKNKDMFYNDEDEEMTDDEWNKEFEQALLKEDKRQNKLNKFKKTLNKNSKVSIKLDKWKHSYIGKITKVYKNKKYFDVLLDDKELNKRKWKKVNYNYLSEVKEEDELNNTLNELKKLLKLKKNKGNKAMMKQFEKLSDAYDKKIKKKKEMENKKQISKNVIEFRKLLKEKSVSNDFIFFKKMKLKEQTNVIKKLKEINSYTRIEKPYRLQLIEANIPLEFKNNALKKINILNYMDTSSGEYYKNKTWVDTFMRIPFNKIKNLPLTIEDGIEKCNTFLENAKKTLDDAVYGLDDAKMQIMQMVGQWIANPESVGNAIAIVGPPGTGKTTLVKQGISKILQRPFSFLALGGATDSSFLEGHSYTYEGSSWGKIVDILIKSKCMNPVIYFDELDKISTTPKGDEITGILTHLTDTSQNDKFHDKYFSSIDFDLSKCLFIFSYNDEQKVNPILKDRMYRITTKGYDGKQKIKIANDYLIPTILKNVKFKKEDVIIPEETLKHIVDNMTDNEKGVRNLKRCLEIIYTKLNLYRLMKPDSELFDKEKAIKVEFPFTVTIENVKKLIKKIDSSKAPFGMYI